MLISTIKIMVIWVMCFIRIIWDTPVLEAPIKDYIWATLETVWMLWFFQ